MKLSSKFLIFSGIILSINLLLQIPGIVNAEIFKIAANTFSVLFAGIASAGLYYSCKSFRTLDFTKITWTLIFIGFFLDFIAEALYFYADFLYGENINKEFPTLADYFWYLAYIPQILAFIIILHGYSKSGFPMGNKKIYFLISALFISMFVLVSYLLLKPIIIDTETNTLEKICYIAYSISDIIIVVFCSILFYITSLYGIGSISRPWKFLVIGYIAITLADLFYSYMSWNNSYLSGSIIDLFWNVGYALVGLSGAYQYELVTSFQTEI